MKKAKFFNLISNGDSCTIILDGYIGQYEEIRSADVTRELLEAEKLYRTIEIRLNSPGGEVYTGMAIFNALRNSKAEVKIFVDGIAASMGGVLALCGRHVEMSKHSLLMLHCVRGGCYGTREDLGQYIEQLEKLEDMLYSMLSEKCGKTPDEIREAYFDGKDHWITADEALELGFIDGIYDAPAVDMPENFTPQEAYAIFHNRYENSLKQEQMFEKLKQLASFANCADEAAVLARINEMTAKAEKYDALEKEHQTATAKIADYEKKEKEAHAAAIEAVLDQAITVDEKFGEDARDGYRAMLESNFDNGKKVIDAMPKKRLAVNDIDDGGKPTGTTKGGFEDRFDEIRKNLK